MNRHQRRAKMAKDRAAKMRHAAVRDAVAYLTKAVASDLTVSGATVITPGGQITYLSAATAQAMARDGAHTTKGRA